MTAGVLADAGPLYAAVDESDAHHLDARRELQKLDQERRNVVIAYPILLEAYSLVLQRLGVPAAHKWISLLAGNSLIIYKKWCAPQYSFFDVVCWCV